MKAELRDLSHHNLELSVGGILSSQVIPEGGPTDKVVVARNSGTKQRSNLVGPKQRVQGLFEWLAKELGYGESSVRWLGRRQYDS